MEDRVNSEETEPGGNLGETVDSTAQLTQASPKARLSGTLANIYHLKTVWFGRLHLFSPEDDPKIKTHPQGIYVGDDWRKTWEAGVEE